jgi:7-carboxy-7-deazaguanine synthase
MTVFRLVFDYGKLRIHMRKYSVHKIFGPTIQGEGTLAGTVCHFVRLSGCNMWDGRPETRSTSQCPFCDTDFFSHTMMTAPEMVKDLASLGHVPWVTISGGEPALQADQPLVDSLRVAGYLVAIETNGTRPLKASFDHVTLSPKLEPARTVITKCDTLKLLFPHPNPAIRPEGFTHIDAGARYLQPVDTGKTQGTARNTRAVIQKLYAMPEWRLSLQIHKLIEVE